MKETLEKEPPIRKDIRGKYRLMNGKVLTTMGSFNTKREAEEWGNWNNFGGGNCFPVVENPDLSPNN